MPWFLHVFAVYVCTYSSEQYLVFCLGRGLIFADGDLEPDL